MKVKINDTVGNKENGIAICIGVHNKNADYELKCEEFDSTGYKYSKLKLVSAFDDVQKTGGYDLDSKGMSHLVNDFEADVLKVNQN